MSLNAFPLWWGKKPLTVFGVLRNLLDPFVSFTGSLRFSTVFCQWSEEPLISALIFSFLLWQMNSQIHKLWQICNLIDIHIIIQRCKISFISTQLCFEWLFMCIVYAFVNHHYEYAPIHKWVAICKCRFKIYTFPHQISDISDCHVLHIISKTHLK